MFKSLVTIESIPAPDADTGTTAHRPATPTPPDKAVPRVHHAVLQPSESVELERIRRNPSAPSHSKASKPAAPKSSDAEATTPETGTERDLEMSRPPSPGSQSQSPPPQPELVAEVLPTVWEPYMNRFRMAAVSSCNLGNALHDSAVGALIPYIEKHYAIGYAVVSCIFVGNALGFIVGAFFIDALRARLGRAGTMAVAQSLMACGYIPIVCSPAVPFPVVVFSFFLIGFGMALNLAMGNTFCAALRSGTTLLGILHGSYGVGGIIGPLIATAIVTAAGANAETGEGAEIWSRYYVLPLALAVCNGIFSYWSFRNYETELGQTATSHPLVATTSAAGPARTSGGRASLAALAGALTGRVVLLGALFIFAYQGAEVSISGWVISFLITARGGDPASVGYVTSGFWAGITAGRLFLSGPGAHRLGERRFVYGLVAGAAVFEALVWSVPNVVGNAVAVAVVGLFLGPVYPCAAAVFMRCMSRADRISGMGIITAFGSSGGAAAPFTTGLLAQVAGTFVLHPIAISLFAIMTVCWWGLPKEEKRTE